MREAVTFGVESSAVCWMRAPSGSNKAESSAAARSKTRGGGRFVDASRDDLIAMIDEKEVAVEALTMKYEQQRARHESGGAAAGGCGSARGRGEPRRRAGEPIGGREPEREGARDARQPAQDAALVQGEAHRAAQGCRARAGEETRRRADAFGGCRRARRGDGFRAAPRRGRARRTNAVLAEKLRRAQDALARLEARERDWNEEKRALLQQKRRAPPRKRRVARVEPTRGGARTEGRARRRGVSPAAWLRPTTPTRRRRRAGGRARARRGAGEPRQGAHRAQRQARPAAPRRARG